LVFLSIFGFILLHFNISNGFLISDTKNDNMRKALEDLQSVERELKSK